MRNGGIVNDPKQWGPKKEEISEEDEKAEQQRLMHAALLGVSPDMPLTEEEQRIYDLINDANKRST